MLRNRFFHCLIATAIAGIVYFVNTDNLAVQILLCASLIILAGMIVFETFAKTTLEGWERLAVYCGSGILYWIVIGLIANQTYRIGFVGLRKLPLLVIGTSIIVLMLVFSRCYFRFRWPSWNITEQVIVSTAGLSLVVMILGTRILNATGNNTLVLVSLTLVLLSLFVSVAKRKNMRRGALGAVLFLIALSMLFSVSLRSDYLSGHDSMAELHVFSLSNGSGHWSMDKFENAYNACMSITILPTALTQLTGGNGLSIFKIIFQLIFALTPVIVMIICARYANDIWGFVTGFLFVSLPTFFLDMPMLARQEIALLFFSLAIFTMTSPHINRKDRTKLFIIFGTGMILTHYSTAYIGVCILVGGVVLSALLSGYLRKRGKASQVSTNQSIDIWGVIVLLLITYLWFWQITGIGGGLEKILQTSAEKFADVLDRDQKSVTVASVINAEDVNAKVLLPEYVTSKIQTLPVERRPEKDPVLTYAIPVTTPNKPIGVFLSSHGINPDTMILLAKNILTKIIQLSIIAGLILVIIFRKYRTQIDIEILAFALLCTAVMGAVIILPMISLNYGLLRLFQQALIILCIPLAYSGEILIGKFTKSGIVIMAILVGLFFFMFSGIAAEITGSSAPTYELHNSGNYYDTLYTHTSELTLISWVEDNTVRPSIFADATISGKLYGYSGLRTYTLVAPVLVRKQEYTIAAFTNIAKGTGVDVYRDAYLWYEYPFSALDESNNLVYSSNFAKVYRKP